MKHSKNKLYSNEDNIVKLVINKLNGYGNSNKELIQKQNELFHLLCFLDLDNSLSLYDYIYPNEPGDFLMKKKEKKILFEVTECFGNNNSYMHINNQLNFLFNRIKKTASNYSFSIEEAKTKIKELIKSKNSKSYNVNNEYEEVILLIVTGEYSGCSSTGNWIIKYLNSCDITESIYKVYILDYYASGKDGNPIIIKNTIKAIEKFTEYFNIFN